MLSSDAWGKMIHEKKPEAKDLVTLSLSGDQSIIDAIQSLQYMY
jgi:hypothetical protein